MLEADYQSRHRRFHSQLDDLEQKMRNVEFIAHRPGD